MFRAFLLMAASGLNAEPAQLASAQPSQPLLIEPVLAPRFLHDVTETPAKSAQHQQALRYLDALAAKTPSVSTGRPNRGRLENPAELPLEGYGFRSIRAERGKRYGTDGLIAGLIEICASLKDADPDMPPLAIGDLSGPDGGRIRRHRSHQSGRDADLVFFWKDDLGRPIPAEEFVRFDAKGRGRWKGRRILLDVPRNWALAKALLTNRHFGERVARIFVQKTVRALLLSHGALRKEGPELLQRAQALLVQPRGRAGSHDNHFHLRIACADAEAENGCVDLPTFPSPAPKSAVGR